MSTGSAVSVTKIFNNHPPPLPLALKTEMYITSSGLQTTMLLLIPCHNNNAHFALICSNRGNISHHASI